MNQTFLDQMKKLLNDDYYAYLDTLSQPAFRGMRVNTLKLCKKEFVHISPWKLTVSQFHEDSFYIERDIQKIGRHPYHVAGLIYLQEPSASSVAKQLDIKPHHTVLDLCAAPGGKSSQLAAYLNHTGLLVSNEIDHKRAMVLLSNLERLGIGENMITNSRPDLLCKEMHGFFDRILVDAPCSGEGMFKMNEQAMADWSIAHVEACAHRQYHILESAYEALKQDGILVYSTCTYSLTENEAVIDAFLQAHEDVELLPIEVEFGRCGYDCGLVDGKKVRRIFPMDEGEGHFMAKLQKHAATTCTKLKNIKTRVPDEVKAFLVEQLEELPTYIYGINDKYYGMDHEPLLLNQTTVLRQGIYLGDMVKKRFEPHHHFYTSAKHQSQLKHRYEMNDDECRLFLHGDVIAGAERGYHAMCWQGFALGFAKGDGMYLKNKFPKGLRLTDLKESKES